MKTYMVSDLPHLLEEWDGESNLKIGLDPTAVAHRPNKMAVWRCEVGHKWNALISNRSRGSGCPVCAGKVTLPGSNDLATENPKLAREWHPTKNDPLTASDVTSGSDKKVHWVCTSFSDHIWETSIKNRVRGGSGCPYCTGKKILSGFNDLSTLRPDMAAEWDSTSNKGLPTEISPSSGRKVNWKCLNDHTWKTSPNSRSLGSGCPHCFASRKFSAIEKALSLCFQSESLNEDIDIYWDNGLEYKVDILLPNKIAIEYDGSYWHGPAFPSKLCKDIEKTTNLIAAGYTVVRVREKPLKHLPKMEGLIQITHDFHKGDIVETANKIKAKLSKLGKLD